MESKNKLKLTASHAAHWLLVVIALIGLYWACEAKYSWMYATAPVAVVTGIIALLSFAWVVITRKRAWLVLLLSATSLVTIALLAIVTIWLRSLG